MKNLQVVSSKTQTEVEKFYSLLERVGNIYLSDINKMDRAFNIVADNIEILKQPENTGINKF